MEHATDLLFDFEETSSCLYDEASKPKNTTLDALAKRIELAVACQPSELARQLHRDAVALLGTSCTGSSMPPDALYRLASGLTGLGYDVGIRNALGGGTSECFKCLRHEFLVVRGTGEYQGMEFIVEPSLRQHFLIPHPSPDYNYVLSRTPDVFVGGSCRLVPVVQLLCALMADSFHRQGLALPPWRSEAAMLSKWLPNPSRVLDLAPCTAVGVLLMCDLKTFEDDGGGDAQDKSPADPPAAAAAAAAGAVAPDDGRRRHSVLSWAPVGPRGFVADAAADPARSKTAVVFGFDVTVSRGRDGKGSSGSGGGGSSSSSEPSGGRGEGLQLPYSDLDECASPCRGPSAGDDTDSFLLGSEVSAELPVHVYDTLSLQGSPAGDGAPPLDFFPRAAPVSASASPLPSDLGGRRTTRTGMLPCRCPCPCLGTGLLSARLLLEPLAAGATAAAAQSLPRPPPAPARPSLPPSSSPPRPCPFTSKGPCVETRPPAHPDAPAIHLVRLAGAMGPRRGRGVAAAAATAGPAPRQMSQCAWELAEWLPWGVPH